MNHTPIKEFITNKNNTANKFNYLFNILLQILGNYLNCDSFFPQVVCQHIVAQNESNFN